MNTRNKNFLSEATQTRNPRSTHQSFSCFLTQVPPGGAHLRERDRGAGGGDGVTGRPDPSPHTAPAAAGTHSRIVDRR
jgi:hypothetical protein